MDNNSVLVYSDDNKPASRNVWVCIEKRCKLRVTQIDVGPLVEEMMSLDDDYERELLDIPLKELKKVLKVKTNKEVLEEIKKRFNKATAFDDIMNFLSVFEVPYRYFSY